MSRKKKNRNQKSSEKILLATVIIQLISAIIDLLIKLIDRLIE